MLIPNIKLGIHGGAMIATLLQGVAENRLETINWAEYSYKPDVTFVIAHDENNIYLRFKVEEDCTAAVNVEDNTSVHHDSCVEFFIALDSAGYYNFEVNAIGALKVHYKDKDGITAAPKEVMASIKREASLAKVPFVEQNAPSNRWSMMLVIPKEAFFSHNLKTFAGVEASANFYKCGDKLSKPHYLSYYPIEFPRPNFHLPQFFGKVMFEK